MKTIMGLKAQDTILSQQMITIKTELDDIAAQNNMLAHDKWMLEQENAQLTGQIKQLQSILTNEQINVMVKSKNVGKEMQENAQ
jgi:hypothetical protein